ncbi:Gx transporter family protein [Ectothiorhodospira sp. BSL-9]|uniref:Gx transporter family protein n=1 Tax=Ectothiorhodospira sp. BSL-9 TaxID=1442136 RepID=UPI0007B451AD|nr:Gx transporter family protein [Ectothiorhodospira sp. BSL-9]ANB01969.1 heptaprenyl diphosphate synthase [Ectothiorhodospira sp. BSL-9]TVQ73519.1 MAG: Gx transporter family protein [Chromatiaceae bacterium]
MQIATTREDHLIAWLAALAIAVHVLEAAFPSPLPGIKPGLANVITVLVLVLYGWRMAAWVTGLRVLAGSLVIGTFLSPTFWLSAAGALCSLAVLGLAHRLAGQALSPMGLCVLAALAHMLGQFLLAWWLFIPHASLLKLLPVLLTFSLIFGLVSGTMALLMQRRLSPPA